MGLLGLRIAASVAITGTACYSPELRDCTLACLATSDCADGQVCGDDGFCAGPELAGQCGTRPPRDARTSEVDADTDIEPMPQDAGIDAPPDATTHGVIAVRVDGKGQVTVLDHGTCDSEGPQNGMCQFIVPLATQITVHANAAFSWRFDKWTTSSSCPDEDTPICTFSSAISVQVGAKFRKGDDDD